MMTHKTKSLTIPTWINNVRDFRCQNMWGVHCIGPMELSNLNNRTRAHIHSGLTCNSQTPKRSFKFTKQKQKYLYSMRWALIKKKYGTNYFDIQVHNVHTQHNVSRRVQKTSTMCLRKGQTIEAEEIKCNIFIRLKMNHIWYFHNLRLLNANSSNRNAKLNFCSQLFSEHTYTHTNARTNEYIHMCDRCCGGMHLVVYRFLSTVKSTVVFSLCAAGPLFKYDLYVSYI